MKYNVIMFGMSSYSDWESGVQNRNYHIMKQLRKDSRISSFLYIDFLPFNIRITAKRFIKDLLGVKNNVVYRDAFSVCQQKDTSFYVFSTISSMFSMNLLKRGIDSVYKMFSSDKKIVWSYNPMFINIFDFNKKSINVFDTVDNWMEHGVYKKYKSYLDKNYREIAIKANLIFMVSPHLKSLYESYGRSERCYFIPNGVDTDYFSDKNLLTMNKIDILNDIKKNNRPVIGYIGTIQENRVDFVLLDEVASYHKDKNIVICGPIWSDSIAEFQKLIKKHANIIYCGPISRDNWLDYCLYFDVTLNPHKVNDFTKYTSPTKIFEYLACGKAVVTTPVEGVGELEKLCLVSKNNLDFCRLIDDALMKDSPDEQKKRIIYSRENFSWRSRVDLMFDYISKYDLD